MLEGPNNLVFDIAHIRNADRVCWEYTNESDPDPEEGWEPTESNLFVRLSPKTLGLVTSGEFAHLNTLTASNLIEWYYRLQALFDADEAFLYAGTDEGEVPLRFTVGDLKDHIGLRIQSEGWSNSQFDSFVRTLRTRNHLREFLS